MNNSFEFEDDGIEDTDSSENNEEQMAHSRDGGTNQVPQQIDTEEFEFTQNRNINLEENVIETAETQEYENESNSGEAETSSDSEDDRTPVMRRNIDGPEWKMAQGRQPVLIPFRKETGVNKHLLQLLIDEEPLEFYSALVDDNIFEYIVVQTDLYATQIITNENGVTSHSRMHDWCPTDIFEIKRLFRLIMGIVRLPKLSDYWSKKAMFKNEFASAAMSRNRFELLLRMVHFADNENNPQSNRLHKIQSLVDKATENIMEIDCESASKMKDAQTHTSNDLVAENFFIKRKLKTIEQKLKRKIKKIESTEHLIDILNKKNYCTNENFAVVMENYFKGFPLELLMNQYKNEKVAKWRRRHISFSVNVLYWLMDVQFGNGCQVWIVFLVS
ncbi:hypothetical protein JTB14_013557 [Gonioctena quinquepunctata]|nr:hypothetical protein JTB14_013557 [Gonioctena quinquepunctata]